ncbi:adenosine deaminase [Rubellicoccus peritrichatus]|uniref:Adenosine deaminase n=1 Tax=Rubellicoccus peritrichatus TaxID=3080537 RepID=A0AAQ3L6D4_9BACT|nr:adenosine deaminase [Puniceicoccus sp. CR14]WOO39896.1 adenosine deaminase [Puniceicoccus sp. CR14]
MAFTTDPETARFIQQLPKTETHLHIEGALPWKLLQRIDPVKFKDVPESWQNDYKFRDFAHFEEQLLGHAFTWYTSPENYHEAAREIFAAHVAANVKYVETSFASGVIEFLGLNGKEVLSAIVEAAPKDLELRVFLGIHHNGFNEKMLPIIEDAIGWQKLTGFDLHGTETIPVDPAAVSIWRDARAEGKTTVAHAGEFCGPDFVRWAIEELGAQKLRHGIRAVEDPNVVELIKINNIPLDICPISNHKLMPGIQISNHPIRELYNAGCPVTISTDDPVSFGNHLNEEYAALYEHRGFNKEELTQVARNGFETAIADDKTKDEWLGEFTSLA